MKRFFAGLMVSIGVTVGLMFAAVPAHAADSTQQACDTLGSDSAFCSSKSDNVAGGNGFAKAITDILLFLVGTAAVIMIVVGGIKYTTSNGDASQVKSAKDTIMYSVIGLIVAIMAWGIVTFVIEQASESI